MMLPFEGIFLIPSLVVAPVALLTLLTVRHRANYPTLWRIVVLVCVVLGSWFLFQVLTTPLYSQRDHAPRNPGGPSGSVFGAAGVFLVMTCVVIPSYPVLVLLACLPPHGARARTRWLLLVASVVFVAVSAVLIQRKTSAYMADYQRTRQQVRPPAAQFEHLRRP